MQIARAAVIAFVLAVPGAAGSEKADRLMAQARASIGSDGTLRSVHGVSAVGMFTKQMPDLVQTGELRIDLELPDRMLRSDSTNGPGGGVFTMLRGVDRDRLLRNSKILNAGPGARMSLPPLLGGTETTALANARAELARFTLALLLTTSPTLKVEFEEAGIAESPDGKADVVVARSADGFAARLFLDQRTHRLLMLTYRGFDPRMFPASSQKAQPSGRAPAPATGSAQPAADLVDLTLYADDFRAEDGLTMPHRFSLAVDGAVDENWIFKSIRINPAFKPGAFSDR